MLRKLTVTLVAAAAVTAAALQPAQATFEAGQSAPIEDSYYPSLGHAGIDVLHYDLNLKWTPRKKRLKGVAFVHFRARASASSFTLDMAPTLNVVSVRMGSRSLKRTHNGKRLVVKRSVAAGVHYTVRIGYRGKPKPVPDVTSLHSVNGLGWHNAGSGRVFTVQEPYGAFTWYPVNDHPSDKALYDIRLDVPGTMVGVSNGRLVSRKKARDRTITKFHNPVPTAPSLVTLAVGPYQRVHQTGPHGLPMSYWVPKAHPGWAKPLRKTPRALRWLEARLGTYPFDRVGIVVPPTSSLVGSQTLLTLGAGNFRYGSTDVRQQVVNLLVKSWYGASVTPKGWRDHWMDAGMSEYIGGQYAAAKGWQRWAEVTASWERNDGYWRFLYGPPGKFKADHFDQTNVRRCTARMLLHLRARIGAAAFDSALKAWPAENANSSRTRGDYVAWLEARTGRELSSFFDTWLMSATKPS